MHTTKREVMLMKTRILAVLCLLAVFVGVFSLAVLPAKATDATYQAGYSKVDINPWVDPEDHSKGFLLPDKDAEGNYIIDANGNYKDCIPLAGYGNTQTRPALDRLDDNGNNVLDDGDGLFATCTAVTDTKGATMFFITMDVISPAGNAVKHLRSKIVSAIRAAGGELYADQIMISGSHSHTGPDLYTLSIAKEDTNPKRAQYYNYILSQITNAAVTAYTSRKDAVMTKTTIDASAAVSAKYGAPAQMSAIRHFAMEGELQYIKGTTVISKNENANMVCGANFGKYHSYEYTQNNNPWTETLAQDGQYKYIMSVTGQAPVATADNTMDLLKFEVAGSDEPIVLINWQAHPDSIGGNNVSSDYIGGLRYRLENNKSFGGEANYRVAFFQGAAGNLTPRSNVSKETWTAFTVAELLNDYSAKDGKIPFIKYGYLLADAALSALEGSSARWSDPLTGEIRHKQITYSADRHVYSDGLHAAAEAWKNGDPDADSVSGFPYAHDYTDGKRYILSSQFHANQILNQTSTNPVSIELNAIFLGEGLAMVTAPNELFDRYNDDGLYKDGAYNAWDKLLGDTYGMPMILGYSNNHQGYIANKAAYHYNENATINGTPVLPIGSYEAANSSFAEGTGEKLMDVYAQLLKEAAEGNPGTPGHCDQCGDVIWQTLDLNSLTASSDLRSGHYRLAGDVTAKTTLKVIPGNKVCLDLNGCALQYNYSTFLMVGEPGATEDATLNIFDSQGGGKVTAPDRIMFVQHRGKVNMYGGVLESTGTDASSTSHAGALYVTHDSAVFNLYGGTIKGGNVSSHGGAVYLWTDAGEANPAQFNIYGGTVVGGTAKHGAAIACLGSKLGLHGGAILKGTLSEAEGAQGSCIYATTAEISLSGNGYVDNILFASNISKATVNLTGGCNIRIPEGITYSAGTFPSSIDLGNVTNGAKLLSRVEVTDKNGAKKYLSVSGSDVTLSAADTTANTLWNGNFVTLESAINNYTLPSNKTDIQAIRLTKDISALTVSKDVCIDLAGHNIGSVTVTGGATLYVMDSATDALNTPDLRCCGSIDSVTGNVQPVPGSFGCAPSKGESWYSGYVTVNTNSARSFHRVDFGITETHTNIEKVGIRYSCGFYADRFVCDAFTGRYGIVVSAKGDPMKDDQAASTFFTTMEQGGNLENASYITNILTENVSHSENKRRGESLIHGRAYFQPEENGPIYYGPEETISLKQSLQQVNENWKTIILQSLKEQTCDLFNTFKSVMKTWKLTAIEEEAIAAEKAAEDEVLKVLTIGNSHSVDAMTMLYEVYQKENPGKKVELGILYYSGCQVDRHILHIQNDYPAYVYYKVNDEIMAETGKWQQNGSLTTVKKLPNWQDMDNAVIASVYNKDNPVTENTELAIDCWTIDMALADEKWDVIVLQQMNNYASDEYWYTRKAYSKNLTDLEWLIRYIKLHAQGAPKLGFHVTWANPMTDSNKSGYINTTSVPDWKNNMEKWYGNNNGNWEDENRITMQHTMFAKIRTCTQKYIQPLAENGTFDYIFFSGAAVQHAFDNAIKTDTAVTANENIYRDYTHMSHYGRLLVAYTWYAELEGIASLNEVKVDTIPKAILHPHDTSTLNLSGQVYNKQLLMNAVNYAINYNYDLPWGN